MLPNHLGWSWGISKFIENRNLAWWWLLNLVWRAPGSSLYFVHYNKYLFFFILCIWNFHYKEEKPTLTPFWFWLKQYPGWAPLLLRGPPSHHTGAAPGRRGLSLSNLHSSQGFLAEFLLLFFYVISLFYFWTPFHAISHYSQQRKNIIFTYTANWKSCC